MSCGVGCRRGWDLALLWLWCRLAATAPIGPLAWEPPYAAGAAQEMSKRPNQTKTKQKNNPPPQKKNPGYSKALTILFFFFFLQPHLRHIKVLGLGVCSCRLMPQPWQYRILKPIEQGQGLNPHPHGHCVGLLTFWELLPN